MTNEEILTKAIKKARENGYVEGMRFFKGSDILTAKFCREFVVARPEPIIFSHKFARAFWGEEVLNQILDGVNKDGNYVADDGQLWYVGPKWQYHLQRIVLEEDPIKYLENFL